MLRFTFCLLFFACAGALCAQAYTVSSGALASYPVNPAPIALLLGDDAISFIQAPTGFRFRYFGVEYTQFRVGSNGYIVMGPNGVTTSPTPDHAYQPGLAISPCWIDMQPNFGGSVHYAFANNRLTLEWMNVPCTIPGGGFATVLMRLILDCTTGVIEFQYGQPSTAGPTTVMPNACAISGLLGSGGTGQTIIPGADAGYIAANGSITAWPALRFMRFTPGNNPPSISVTALNLGVPVQNGQTVNAGIGGTMTTLAPKITVNDPDGDACALTGTVSNVTTQGILAAEFSSATAPVPYTLSPTTGVFNRAIVTHTFLLQADDGKGGSAQFTFHVLVQAAPGNSAPVLTASAGASPVSDGGTVNVAWNSTLAVLSLAISVDDADGDATEVTSSISGVTTEGLVSSEFESTRAAVPYGLNPASGTFNAPGATLTITLSADDYRGGTATFTFDVVVGPVPGNNPPSISVSALGSSVSDGGTINVAWNTPLSTMNLVISLTDLDLDNVSVNASVSNPGTTGLIPAEFGSGSTATPYSLLPGTGAFNVAGATHHVTLTANDGRGGIVTFSFDITVGPGPGFVGTSGVASGGGGSCAAGEGTLTALLALALSALLAIKRRQESPV
jgi:hypothetical protein